MTTFQKIIQYLAMAFAVFFIVSIIGGILSAIGFLGGFLGNNGVSKDMTTYSVSQMIEEIEMDVNAADVKLTTGKTFSVESNLAYLSVEEKESSLIIKETENFWFNSHNAVLSVCIPEGFVFKNANIMTGAGKLTVDMLSADRLHLELGAGAVNIRELNAGVESQIEGGAGKVTVSGGTLYNLDLNMGVGKLDLTAAVLGNSKLDYGVGGADITLIGTKDDYRIQFDKGLGSAVVDGESMEDGSVFGKGDNRIEIDGGVGSVKVDFKQKQ